MGADLGERSGGNREVRGLRAVAITVATEAADLVQEVRADAVRPDSVRRKQVETDVVTEADLAAETLVRARLATLRPGEPVLGEEEGGDPSTSRLCWVVDPIDGTTNYLYGFPWYAVSVAAQLGGRSVAGAVVEPATGRVWSAEDGNGAFLGDQLLRTSSTERLDLALVSTGFGCTPAQRAREARVIGSLLDEVRDLRRCGTAALDLCAVAAGWTDAHYETGLNRWDWAAGALIAAEAGAEVHVRSSLNTRDADTVVCSAPGVANRLRTALVKRGTELCTKHPATGRLGTAENSGTSSHCWVPAAQ